MHGSQEISEADSGRVNHEGLLQKVQESSSFCEGWRLSEEGFCESCGVELSELGCGNEDCDRYSQPGTEVVTKSYGGHRLPTMAEWTFAQKKLAIQLGLSSDVQNYLGRVCTICGKPCSINSHVSFCPTHKPIYLREMNRRRQIRYREKRKSESEIGKS